MEQKDRAIEKYLTLLKEFQKQFDSSTSRERTMGSSSRDEGFESESISIHQQTHIKKSAELLNGEERELQV